MSSIHGRRANPIHWPRASDPRVLFGVLAATKFADVATTLVGIQGASHVREANPLVADAITAVGAPTALLAFWLAAVGIIVAVTEAAVTMLSRLDDTPPGAATKVRLVGYGLPSIVHVLVAAQNTVVLLSA